MKFGQLIKLNMRNIIKNYPKNEIGRLVPDLFLFLKKSLHNLKASGRLVNLLVDLGLDIQ